MIKGIKNWSDPSIRYDQTENAVENIISKIKSEIEKDFRILCSDYGITNKEFINEFVKKLKGYLESCGVSSACCIIEGMGLIGNTPETETGQSIQFDDFTMNHMNDPRKNYHNDMMSNRIFANYPIMAEYLFNVTAEVMQLDYNQIIKYLLEGNGVQLCLKDPGHFIAAIATDGKNIIYNDSWGSRDIGIPALKKKGLHEFMSEDEFNENVNNLCIVYFKE